MSRLLPQRVAEPSPEEGFRSLIDALPVGMVWVDEAGTALEWNDPAETLLSSGAGVRIEQLMARLLEACKTTQTCIQSALELSGSERVQVSIAPDRTPGTYVVVLDRQRLEKARTEASVLRAVLKAIGASASRKQAAQKALEAVHAALSATHLAFFELDGKGEHFTCLATSGLSDAEPNAAALVNQPGESMLSVVLQHERPVTMPESFHSTAPLPFHRERGLAAVLMPVQGRSSKGVLYLSTREGLSDGLLRLCHALADAIGAVLDLASLEREAARAREVATQRDRLATIGQLVAGVAHEINNPLAFLKSNLHSLRGDLEELREGREGSVEMQEVDEIVSESIEGVSRIETIVQALKGTARKKDEKIRFEPGKAVMEAVTIFRGAHKQNVDVDCKVTQLPEVIGSPSAIGQLILNLLQNGMDAMASLDRKRRKLEVSARCDEERVVIAVRDHGSGIPADVQKRMFDAFFTTKDPGKGTGLGLAICKEIAEGLGGSLTYTTGAEGTCFELGVPVDPN